MTTAATSGVQRAARAARHSVTLAHASRVGLAGRGVFYLVLAYLAAQIGVQGGGRQADAEGVFRTVAAQPLGTAAITVAAFGVLAFALARVAAGIGDRGVSLARRASAVGQGGTYLAIAAFTTYFLLKPAHTGPANGGTEQTEVHHLFGVPLGAALLVAIGVTIVALCGWQIWNALSQGYAAGMATEKMAPRLHWLLRATGTVGIAVRAAAVVPLGVLLVVAALTHRAATGVGLNAVLDELAAHWWGLVLLALITTGFGLFAIYSFLEAGYRKVHSGC